jgi:hypothetical protein
LITASRMPLFSVSLPPVSQRICRARFDLRNPPQTESELLLILMQLTANDD